MKCLICHEEWDEVEDAVLCCTEINKPSHSNR